MLDEITGWLVEIVNGGPAAWSANLSHLLIHVTYYNVFRFDVSMNDSMTMKKLYCSS